ISSLSAAVPAAAACVLVDLPCAGAGRPPLQRVPESGEENGMWGGEKTISNFGLPTSNILGRRCQTVTYGLGGRAGQHQRRSRRRRRRRLALCAVCRCVRRTKRHRCRNDHNYDCILIIMKVI